MDVMEAIKRRREITKFTNEQLSTEHLDVLLEAGYLAPSGNNLPSRELILVTNKNSLEVLAKATPFVPWVKDSAASIVVTGRPDVSKYWLQDASIASGFIWLAAVELGLGAAFGAIYHSEDKVESERREEIVRKELAIPSDRNIVSIIGVGHIKEEPKQKKMLPRDEIIYYDTFK